MELTSNDIKSKITQYFNKSLSKRELSKWAYATMYSMFDGDIYKLSILALYRIIAELTRADDGYESSSDKEIETLKNVLDGVENEVYVFQIKLSRAQYKKEYVSLLDSLCMLKQKVKLSESELLELQMISTRKIDDISTISEKLEMYICDLLSSSYNIFPSDGQAKFGYNSMVFLAESDENEEFYLSRIIRYLKCYLGKDPLTVCVEYRNGISDVSLIV